MLPARMASAKMLIARMRWRSIHRPDQRSARSCSSFFSKTVSDSVKRLDPLEAGVDGAKLAPQPLDVAVDRAVVDIDVFLIGDVHQLVARLYDAGTLRQRLQDHEFGDSQRHVLAVPGDAMPGRIHDPPTADDLGRLA